MSNRCLLSQEPSLSKYGTSRNSSGAGIGGGDWVGVASSAVEGGDPPSGTTQDVVHDF